MHQADFEAPLAPQKLLNLIKRVREKTTFALEGLVDKEEERHPAMVYQRLARVVRVVRQQTRAAPRKCEPPNVHDCAVSMMLYSGAA